MDRSRIARTTRLLQGLTFTDGAGRQPAGRRPVPALLNVALLIVTLIPVHALADGNPVGGMFDLAETADDETTIDDSELSEEDADLLPFEDEFGRIFGLVWVDDNGDGVHQGDEEPLVDVELTLVDDDDNEIDSVVSDDTGEFVFDDVDPGEYLLRARVPEGLETTTLTATGGDDGFIVASDTFLVEAGEEVEILVGLTPIAEPEETAAEEETEGPTENPEGEVVPDTGDDASDVVEEANEAEDETDELENAELEAEEEEPIFAPLSVSPSDTYVNAATFYAYLEAGETLDLVFTKNWTASQNPEGTVVTVEGPGGVTNSCQIVAPAADGDTCVLTGLTSASSGVWRIVNSPGPGGAANRYTWQIDVNDGMGVIDGRVWAEEYAMTQLVTDGVADFTFWYQSEHGYTYQATYGGFNGINSIIYADATGVAFDGTCTSAYKSWDDEGTPNSDPDLWVPPLGACGDLYKIFFEEPAADLPASADRWDGSTDWVVPPIGLPSITSVTFTPDSTTVRSGTIDYTVDNFTGQLVVEIDTNNDGTFDVAIPGSAIDGAGSVDFDGFDGSGDPVSPFQQMAVRVSILQVGEIHFSNWDVEIRSGIEVTRLNGPNPGDQTIYWDDTDLVVAGRDCVTPQLDGTAGVNSAGGVHGWDCDDNPNDGIGGSWGDVRYIDDWTFVPIDESMEILVEGDDLSTLSTFVCDSTAYLFQGAPTSAYGVNLVTGENELLAADFSATNQNAAGYNPADDYIYAFDSQGVSRIGSDFAVEPLGLPSNWGDYPVLADRTFQVGDFDADGTYWIASGSYVDSAIPWAQIDLRPGSPTYMEVLQAGEATKPVATAGFFDWGYSPVDGNLYIVASFTGSDDRRLWRFNTDSGTITGMFGLGNFAESGSPFGAVYTDPSGYLYASNNGSGEIFRITTDGTNQVQKLADGPSSGLNDGARCFNAPLPIDFGDAPASYGTLLDDDGPRHAIPDYDINTNTSSLMLGTSVDIETDGQPSANADGDDLTDVDDEDGVADQIVLIIGEDTDVEVVVTNNTGEPATLAGWIDLDHNGTFDGGELQWLVVPPNTTDTFTLTWPAPALPGDGTYARFRLFPGEVDEADLSPTGPASSGEVEDYAVIGPVAIDLQCPIVYAQQGGSPYNIYEVDTSTGDMTVVGQFAPGSGTNNGLGISADARYLFGHRNGEVLRFDSETGVTDTFAGVPGLNATHGGVDPSSGIYYYGNIATGVFGFDPATETSLGQVATLSFDIAPDGANGDWSFDAQGNLYVVAGSATNSSLYVVSGLPTTAQPTPVVVTGQRLTTFSTGGAAVNGVAFDATGSLYAASNAIIFEIDPATGDILDQQSLSPSGVSVDLASCSTPPTIVVQKDIVERFDPGDQFEVTVTGGGITENNVGTTTGSDTGLQTEAGEFAGPVLGRPGTTYDIAETGVNGADLANYTTTWQCVNETAEGAVVAEGEGASGSFVMPASLVGAAIVCTFLNEPTGYMVAKTADPQSGTTLRPGDTVTYTVTLTNLGTVDLFDVEAFDDLSGVLDDAELSAGPVVDPVAAGTAEIVGDTLTFVGDLPAGEQVTVTYTVTVLNTSDVDGDGVLVNAVTSPEAVNCPDPAVTDPQDPDFDPDCVTVHPVRDVTIVKSSDPGDGTAVAPGDTVTYTLEITNTGGYDYTLADPAEVSDDLSGVIDDAVYNNDADSGGVGSVGYTAPVLTWTGPLAAGGVVTITYTVTVLAADGLGDAVLENVVTGTDSNCPDPAITDPDDPDYDPDCHNSTPVGAVHYLKTVDPEDPLALQPGDTYTYTVTVSNIGATDLEGLSFTDDLSDVLDDATFEVGSETADIGTAEFNGTDAVDWSGDLEVGQVATITYEVTIDSPPSGNSILINGVLGDGPGSNCPPPGPAAHPDCFKQIPQPLINTVKTSDAVGEVEPGDIVEYEFTVSNDGTGPARIFEVRDHLDGVLDDATYNGDLTLVSGLGGVVFDPVNEEIVWTGELDVGESATVAYSVTVNDATDLGDGVLRNAVTSPDCFAPPTFDPDDPLYDPDCVTEDPIRAWSGQKTSDAAGNAEPGDTVTYTITVENTGGVDLTDIGLTDDLSGILDDATLEAGSLIASFGDVSFDPLADELTWEISPPDVLEVGQTVIISYSVTVNDADSLGDGVLVNAITGPMNCPDPAITDPQDADFDPDCVLISDVEAWTVVKSSDASDPVLPGDVVTYTLTVANTGSAALAAADVLVTDDLTSVLDDATYNDDATQGAVFADPVISWSDDLAVDQVVTITYSVTVNAASELGDGVLANAVTGGDCPDPAVTDPADPDFDETCVVVDDIEAWTVVKFSDAGNPVLPSDVVTYTLTVTNTGNVDLMAADVEVEDDLTDVLDDASYNGDADQGAVFVDPILSWSDDLAVGEAVTITYSVTVNDASELGDGVLANAVVGGDCPDPAITDPSDPDFDPDCVSIDLIEAYTVEKVAQAPQLVLPGDVVSYTIVVTNTGGTALAGAAFDDDLSGVLDDASYNDDAAADVGSASYSEPVLSWVGDLAVGQQATITYTVTVDNPITGDFSLENTVTGGDCDPCGTVTPLPGIHFAKQIVGPDGVAELEPGDTFTYVVTVTNTGQVDLVDQSFEDDLSDVLDDASYNNDGAATIGSVSYAEPVLTWEGDLAIGEVATVTYTVTIDDPVTGDGVLRNAVTSDGPNSNCVPPDPSDPACRTEFPQAVVEVSKELVGPTEIEAGSVVTYRITAHNRGGATAVDEQISDDLSGVLDDASYNGDATVSKGTVGYAPPVLSWTLDIDPGETVELVYSVTVNPAEELGDGRLINTATGGINCPEDGEECGTDDGVGAVRYEKTIISPANGEAEPGDTVTYRITVFNLGGVDLEDLEFTDDLTKVLAHASLEGSPVASAGQVTFALPTLRWTGDLAAGETAAVTYSVALHENAPAETAVLNVVVGNGPGSNCTPNPGGADCRADFDILSTTVTSPLPFTGVDLLRLLLLALAATAVGFLIVTTARRRDPTA